MPLQVGARLGPYEILPLGAGGMGEVYRARDAKLDRDLAINVLLSILRGTSPSSSGMLAKSTKSTSITPPALLMGPETDW